MAKLKVDPRTRLLQAAVKVTYRYGFLDAEIADIAEEARVALGHV
jgi:AcrR family transcriptional regulator